MATSVTHSAQSASDPINLPQCGDWIIRIHDPLAGAFTVDIQEGDGTNWADVYFDATTKVTLSDTGTPLAIRVPGGTQYRMNITAFNNPLVMSAYQINF